MAVPPMQVMWKRLREVALSNLLMGVRGAAFYSLTLIPW